mmetsp:Transcript_27751/g.31897  ORF Transcript_27751/g.31897 Transcript_27751/m.31897 type:complete len:110 (+) Transcript_27751:291-620(+)
MEIITWTNKVPIISDTIYNSTIFSTTVNLQQQWNNNNTSLATTNDPTSMNNNNNNNIGNINTINNNHNSTCMNQIKKLIEIQRSQEQWKFSGTSPENCSALLWRYRYKS